MYDTSLPSTPEPWITHANFLISAILLIPAIGNFLMAIAKERGKAARAARIVKDNKMRADVLQAMLSIREKVLQGDQLAEAKADALGKVEGIERQMRNGLSANATKNFSVPVIGVPKWRVTLALYKPVTEDRAKSIIMRVVFLYSLLVLFAAMFMAIFSSHPSTISAFWY
ncbi:hypothetical protein ACPOL_3394 [Acidisarcina polymorpha]|uniref:Uncharacterized protein n=1 Tax=Acidisarcina polymorpha TaxID=2211140 RepID=A0A2Z5G0K3_9BACT|nr:hypothetical protein [Acidisarcina polymorpha]AXC12681.1 hypothetical protein ACPOL_3394 [Acidisarcina polymorpha]